MSASKKEKIESTPVEEKKVVKKVVNVSNSELEERLESAIKRLKKVEERLGL
jgi:hypothetical protein